MYFDRRILRYFDWGLLGLCLAITLCGLLVLYSAGYDPDNAQKIFPFTPFRSNAAPFYRQGFFILVGLIMMLAGASIPSQWLYRFAYPLYAVCVVLLAAVLAVGVIAKGSQRWLSLGPISFQPSEMMKLAAILCMSRYLSRAVPPAGGYRITGLIVPCLIFGLPMVLIMAQPDLGTALAIGAVGFAMVLFMGVRWRTMLLMGGCAVAAFVPAWEFLLHDYQKRRVMVLFNPEADPLGSGYHIIQSTIAVGSGLLFGKGFMQGTQTQLEFLPEHTTDFIFSVLAEEWGFVGCIFVLLLYALLIFKLLRVVNKSKDLFLSLVVLGVTAQVFLNAAINVGMVVGMLPVVGIPLPLFSYGGTSLISTMFALGIVLGISTRRWTYLVR
ncbi:MAG: rod shape-determining protein RodA [Oligoflexia bacterium]|nr:rod shape-determining protein RodA [Oligoflexia bacterium]